MNPFDLTDRTALVTGSSRGIGRALARGLLEAGCRVVVHGRDRSVAAATAAELGAATGGPTQAASFDVTDPDSVEAGLAEVEECCGTPDILVNNAGVQRRGAFEQFSVADWDDLMAANLTSAFLVSRRLAAGMISRGSGKIINIGSVTSRLARKGVAPYGATKGGVVMLTRGMCADLASYGIQTNAIAPGYFDTEMNQALTTDPGFSSWVEQRTPAGRWGRVEDLVGTLVYLSAPASDFVNGQIIYVDGGMTAVV